MAIAKTSVKRDKKKVIQEHAQKFQPVLGDLSGAVVGGVVGAFAPKALSAFGGIGLMAMGAYTQRSWITSTGAAMIVTTVTTGANMRQAPKGKTDIKTELHNGKERAKSFLKAFGDKFTFWKKKDQPESLDEENLDGLGTVDAAHFAALDELNHRLIEQGLQMTSQSEGTIYPMVYPGNTHY